MSLQSQLCAIRGAFHLCFKGGKKKKQNEFICCKVFRTMLVVFTQSSNLWESKSLQRPTIVHFTSQSPGGDTFNQKVMKPVCLRSGGMTD